MLGNERYNVAPPSKYSPEFKEEAVQIALLPAQPSRRRPGNLNSTRKHSEAG